MSIQTKYAPLFHLRLLHDAELDLGPVEWEALSPELRKQRESFYNINTYLRITPTPDLRRLMAQHRLILRETPFGASLYAKVVEDPDDVNSLILAFPLDDGINLRFHLDLRVPNFPSSANLPLDGLGSKTLYLTNEHEHEEQGQLHLTREIPAFDDTRSYLSGDLVVDDGTTPTILLEAKRSLDPEPTPGADDWLPLPAPVYAGGTTYEIEQRIMHDGILYEATSSGDHLAPPSAEWTDVYRPFLRTGVTSADHVHARGPLQSHPVEEDLTYAKASLVNSDEVEVESFQFFHETGENLRALEFDLRAHPAGFYRLEASDSADTALTGFPKTFYLDPTYPNVPPFGIIELFNRAGSHGFLDSDGHPLAPTFHARFRKRHTFWRYHFSGNLKDFPPVDTGDLEVDPGASTRYLSEDPLPLTSGSVALNKFGDLQLPNPDFTNVKPEDSAFFSDLYILI